jgi:hypothetical protein
MLPFPLYLLDQKLLLFRWISLALQLRRQAACLDFVKIDPATYDLFSLLLKLELALCILTDC